MNVRKRSYCCTGIAITHKNNRVWYKVDHVMFWSLESRLQRIWFSVGNGESVLTARVDDKHTDTMLVVRKGFHYVAVRCRASHALLSVHVRKLNTVHCNDDEIHVVKADDDCKDIQHNIDMVQVGRARAIEVYMDSHNALMRGNFGAQNVLWHQGRLLQRDCT